IEALCDPDADVRNTATAMVEKLGPRAAPGLLKVLKDTRPEVRELAAGLLGECRGDLRVVLPALLAVLDDDKESSVRGRALRSFASLGRERKETVPHVLRALKDRDRAVRRAAIQMLGTFGPAARDAVPQLLELLKSRDEEMRCDTIRTLGDLGPVDKRILPALRTLLDEKQDLET